MQLYFKPDACSRSARIVLTEIGLAYNTCKVDTEVGMTENPAILQFLADTHPESRLALAYVHKAFGTYFRGCLLEHAEREEAELCIARCVGDVECIATHPSVRDALRQEGFVADEVAV